MEKWVCKSLRHISELESALWMAIGNKQLPSQNQRSPKKKCLKGYFSPDFQLSQKQRRHRARRLSQRPARVGWARGGGRLRGASVPPALAAIPARTPPAAHPALLHHQLHGKSRWQLQAGLQAACGELRASANPASACGCCEGTPIQTREVFAPPRWKESFSQLTELSPTILPQKAHKLGKHSCNTYFCYAFMFILFFSRASFPNWVQDPICTGLTSTQRGETFSALKLRTEVQEVLRERAWSSSVGQATNTLPGLGATRQKRLGTRRHGQSLSEPVDS